MQQGRFELLARNDISEDQLFFYIASSLRKRIVERIIQDLGIENHQIVDSLQADCIKQYFEMFPVSDYISESLIVLEVKRMKSVNHSQSRIKNVKKRM